MVEILTYLTGSGRSPVFDSIRAFPPFLSAKVVRDIDLLGEFGITLGEPHVKKLKGTSGEIWELRSRRSGIQARTLFTILDNEEILLLHSFIKKVQRVPRKEIRLAESRLKLAMGEIR